MINVCPPRSSTGKWVVLRRELGGNAVDEKSVAVGIGVGYQEDPRRAKKSTPPVRGGGGGGFEKPPELYCTWRSGVRSTMHAASQLSGRGPTDVDVASVPAC